MAARTLAVALLILPWIVGCGEEASPYDRLLQLRDEVSAAPAPMTEDDARDVERRCIADLSKLANSTQERDGKAVRLQAALATFKIASLFLHRHNDARVAKNLMNAAKDVFTDMGTPAARRHARVVARKLERLNRRFQGSHLDRDVSSTDPTAPPPTGDGSHAVGIQN